MERAPGGDRSLVGARPVRDWGETSDRTVLHHEVEILGARAQRQPHRPIPRRAARPTHREDAAHIIRSLGRLPAIEQSPRAFGDDMLREKDIAAVPSVGESALLLSDGERRATLTHP